MGGPHDQADWRIYEAGNGIMMTRYDTFGDAGLTNSSRLASATYEAAWLHEITDRIWRPLVMEIVGISKEENRQFRDEYIASVT